MFTILFNKLKDHPEELSAFEAIHGRGKSAVQALQTTTFS